MYSKSKSGDCPNKLSKLKTRLMTSNTSDDVYYDKLNVTAYFKRYTENEREWDVYIERDIDGKREG